MSQLPNGSFVCDKCDAILPSDSIVDAARTAFMADDGSLRTLHYCMRKDADSGAQRCAASTVVSDTNLRGWKTRNPDATLRVFSMDRDLNADGSVREG